MKGLMLVIRLQIYENHIIMWTAYKEVNVLVFFTVIAN